MITWPRSSLRASSKDLCRGVVLTGEGSQSLEFGIMCWGALEEDLWLFIERHSQPEAAEKEPRRIVLQPHPPLSTWVFQGPHWLRAAARHRGQRSPIDTVCRSDAPRGAGKYGEQRGSGGASRETPHTRVNGPAWWSEFLKQAAERIYGRVLEIIYLQIITGGL